MRGIIIALLILGFPVIVGGLLALLNETGILILEWHFIGPLLVVAFGFRILLCATECYSPRKRTETSLEAEFSPFPF